MRFAPDSVFFDLESLSSPRVNFENWDGMQMRTTSFRSVGVHGMVLLVFLAEALFGWAQGRPDMIVVKATKHVLAPSLSERTPASLLAGRLSSSAERARLNHS